MSMKLTKTDVNCARSRSGFGVSSDSMIGVRKCWRVQVRSGLKEPETFDSRNTRAQDPRSKIVRFRKIR